MTARNAMSRADRTALLCLQRVSEALVATIAQQPLGAPEAALYRPLAPIMGRGEFASLTRLLCNAGRIAKHGDRFYPMNQENPQ